MSNNKFVICHKFSTNVSIKKIFQDFLTMILLKLNINQNYLIQLKELLTNMLQKRILLIMLKLGLKDFILIHLPI